MRTPEETALLIAIAFQRSKQTRGRISQKSVQRAAQRDRLHAAFVVALIRHLAEYEVIMAELSNGAYGLLQTRTLLGAKTITIGNVLTEDELSGKIEVNEDELDYDRADFDDEE